MIRRSRWAATLALPFLVVAGSAVRAAEESATGIESAYAEEHTCERCHRAIAETFRDHGMARSLSDPEGAEPLERFGEIVHHAASRRSYRIDRRDQGLVFRRWVEAPDGGEEHVLELPVSWIVGSGSRSRVYLHRAPGGELFQLPVAWYSQEARWGMAPGYDRPDHEGVGRRIRRECLFCHDAYPDLAYDGAYHDDQVFPPDLPRGVGCQRCHGPGAEHVAAVERGAAPEEVAAAIVDPADLDLERRRDVCRQCHLQPSVAISGLRVFGRSVYSYRPGEVLSEYLVPLDVAEAERAPDERFEINHHAYRLEQSSCWTAASGLECLTCHDPHRRLPDAARRARANAACSGCHETPSHPAWMTAERSITGCVRCHMPQRRPQDVVLVTMTDHRIQRPPPPAAEGAAGLASWLDGLVAPLEESTPTLVDVVIGPAAPVDAELARAVATLRAGGAQALPTVARRLQAAGEGPAEAWLDLAQALLAEGRGEQAIVAAERYLASDPDHEIARRQRATGLAFSGRGLAALAALRELAARDDADPETIFNLARAELAAGDLESSREHLHRALELRPNLLAGWLYLGRVEARAGRREQAIAAWREGLRFDPGVTDLYVLWARELRQAGRAAEARAVELLARRSARWPEALEHRR